MTFTGGEGKETYRLVDTAHTIQETESGGWDTVHSWVDHTLAPNVEKLQLFGAAETGNGTDVRNVLIGNAVANTLRGEHGDDSLYSRDGDDRLYGGGGDDIMKGGGGDDILMGGGGHDTMYGGSGADEFEFTQWDLGETDTIAEFVRTEGDRIDLVRIDADAHADGNQAFRFLGTEAFTGAAGELRFAGGVLQGDVDGDGQAELTVAIPNLVGPNLVGPNLVGPNLVGMAAEDFLL
jgi:Ca2+-binding RTX toxin-like protein